MDVINTYFKNLNNYDNENANITHSINRIEASFNGESQKELADEFLGYLMWYHTAGYLHIHDMDFFATRAVCLQHNIKKILEKGLNTNDVKSKPAKRLHTALSHAYNSLALGQNNFAGGQSAPTFNVFMAPYCSKEVIFNGKEYIMERLPEEHQQIFIENEIRSAIQHFLFQTNQQMLRMDLQSIFLSLNMEFTIPDFLKNEKVYIGGEEKGVYGNYEEELKLFNRIYMEELNKGDANNKPFVFPNTIWNYRGITPDEELIKLIMKNMFNNSNVYLLNGVKYGKNLTTSMGCVTGDTKITFRYGGRTYYNKSIEFLWDYVEDLGVELKETNYEEYYDLTNYEIEIYEGGVGEIKVNGFTSITKLIRRETRNIYTIKTKNNEITCSPEHIFLLDTFNQIRVNNLKLGDKIKLSKTPKDYLDLGNSDINNEEIIELKKNYKRCNVYDVETLTGAYSSNNFYSHNCRTALSDERHDNPWQSVYGTGNLSYITLNLPRIILEHISKDIDKYELLDEILYAAVKILLIKRKIIIENYLKGLYPFLTNELYKDENGYYYNVGMTSMAIGFVGLADVIELCNKFKVNINPDGLLSYIKAKLEELNKMSYEEIYEEMNVEMYNKPDDFLEYTNFTMIGSPAESCSHRFLKCDMNDYHNLLNKTSIKDKKYYTNSIMVDERKRMTAHEKIIEESKYHRMLNGGIITHIWNAGNVDESQYNTTFKYFENLMKETDVRYFTISNVIVNCKECGVRYIGNKNDIECKECNSNDIRKMVKITGYIQDIEGFNVGKSDEVENREEFKILDD